MVEPNIDERRLPRNAPKCHDCGERTKLGWGRDCYPDEPEFAWKDMWVCECGAFGGCKRGSLLPASRPAGPETRAARNAAYTLFMEIVAHHQRGLSHRQRKRVAGGMRFKCSRAIGGTFRNFQFGWLTLDEAKTIVRVLEDHRAAVMESA